MKLLLALFVTLNCLMVAANNDVPGWQSEYGKKRSFIENKGQFDKRLKTTSPILFAHDGGDHNYFFTKEGVVFELSHKTQRERSEQEKEIRRAKKSEGGLSSHEEWQTLQATDFQNRLIETRDELSAIWVGANPDVEIIAEDKDNYYHSYSFYNSSNELKNINEISSFQKLIYKNIYPNIDVIYEFHEEIGIKYSVILHPGADPSVVQLKYSKDIELLSNGKIKTSTALGDIIDHEPLTFYAENNNSIINSKYRVQGNIISFQLSNYDNTKKVVIDPWTQTPNFNTNWKCVWECEKDGAGNVYIIGGVMPLQLLKYNPAGALQWTYNTPYDSTMWLGTFATDDLGNSYVSNGSEARMQKISTAGAMLWNNANPSGLGGILTEFWTITFNCDQTRLVIGGTGGSFIPVSPYIYEMDMNSGNVLNSAQVHVGGGFDGSEVRSITPTTNGRYYFLSHDSLGYIHNNLSACGAGGSGSSSSFLVDNGTALSYKCENYRYNNSGIASLSYYEDFIFYNRGNQLQKRDFYTGAVIATVNIPGGGLNGGFGGSSVSNSGIDIDDCGNIYVGSTNGVYVFDQNLTQLNSFATSFNVYDVNVSTGGDVIACGSTGTSSNNSRTGYIQSFSAGACSPTTIVCCDVALCPVEDLCLNDDPVSITPIGTPGGTWSGTGVDASGIFDPAVAGVGSHDITYTLACGAETVTIIVNECPELEICIDENGDLVATGGDGNYNWATGVVTPVSYPINSEQECIDCPSTTPEYVPVFGFYDGCSSNTCNTTDTTWTPAGAGNTYTPTTYPLLVVDGNGTFVILENATGLDDCEPTVACPTITVTVQDQTNVLCFGDFSGSATVNASGGNGPYNYIWTPGNLNGPTQSNLSAQTYTVNVTDNDGCPGTVEVNITEPTPLSATTSSTEACGGNDGSATINVSGGAGSYSYDWDPNVGNTATVTDLGIGDYEVTVTDGNGCTIIETISVTCDVVPCPTITVSITNQTDVLCFGGNTGSVTVSASGGNGPYNYIWDSGLAPGATQNALSAQTYSVTVTDSDDCPGSLQVTINQPTQLTATTSSVEASCGESDGSATVNPSGGTGSYTYTWTPNVGSTATVNNIPAGSYQVTVTDANNCQHQENILVNNQNAPSLSIISTTDESCVGAADGEATVEASGGSGNYTYSWSPSGGTSATASNLTAGNYTVTVTDDAGCETSIVVTINSASAILIDAIITDEDCGMMNGELVASASGGNGNYSYTWSNGETTSTISNLQTGEYSVTITDDLGCSNSETFTVGVIGSLDVTVNPTTTTIEAGESVQLEASGGFSYTWTPETGLSCTDCPNPVASPINTTNYTVTVVDENGCAGEATVYVFVEALCGEFFVPTIFSPNADGTNDNHCVLGGCVTEFELIIYNRWGERVFVSRDQTNCWDGNFRGQKVQSGVYVYKIKAALVDGTSISDSGNINVVR